MLKKAAFFFIFLLFIFSFNSLVLAKEFGAFYKTTYLFGSEGTAFVTQEISLINLTSDYYVSEYSLSLKQGRIGQVEAYDKVGPIQTLLSQNDDTTFLTLKFNEKVVGRDKVLSFILKYRSEDIAVKEGNLWNISIPKLARPESIDDYQLVLKIPLSFGKVSFVNPPAKSHQQTSGYTQLTFEKNDLVDKGVMVTFGQYQTFDFELNYDLTNSDSVPRYEKIVIPPDTDFQTVYFQEISPEPLEVTLDDDGNWLAGYRLDGGSSLSIKVIGKANIFFEGKEKKDDEKDIKPNEYLSAEKYWPVEDETIKAKAKELGEVEKIYRFVVGTLTYDYDQVKPNLQRKGALAVLKDPSHSICTDFTDLFITLCRAAGIPARELAGFAFTENEKLSALSKDNDLLHSWAEYYDFEKGKWIGVDPTWEKTTGGLDYFNQRDMSHFVFVTHGKSDTLPSIPGSYKGQSSSKRQVFVNLAGEEINENEPFLEIISIQPSKLYSFSPIDVQVTFKNKSGYALYNFDISAKSPLSLNPDSWHFDQILPYKTVSLNLKLKAKEQLKDYQSKITFNLNNRNEKTVDLLINSLLIRLVIFGGIAFILLLSWLLFGQRKRKTDKINSVEGVTEGVTDENTSKKHIA